MFCFVILDGFSTELSAISYDFCSIVPPFLLDTLWFTNEYFNGSSEDSYIVSFELDLDSQSDSSMATTGIISAARQKVFPSTGYQLLPYAYSAKQ